MGKGNRKGSPGPSRRQFIAGGSALLALGSGSLAAGAIEVAAQSVKQGQQGIVASADAGNALYRGAVHDAHANARDWKAFWITSPQAPQRAECVLRFRKEFVLDARPARLLIHVSADNGYLLKVNGRHVGTGPSHSDVEHWKYTTYDIASYLEPGRNLVSATVWNFGEHAPVRQISERIGFLLDSDAGSSAELHTDDSWMVAVETGLSALAMPQFAQHFYYVASAPERLDAAVLRWEWDDPRARVSVENGWHSAALIGRASSRGVSFAGSAWQLTRDGLPLMERRQEAVGKVVRVTGQGSAGLFPSGRWTIPAHQQATVLIDRGHLTTAYPELAFSRGRGAEIRLTYAEALYDAKGRKGNRNDIKGKHIEGVYDLIYPDGSLLRKFTPLDWRTWRYLQVDVKTGDAALDLDGLRGWFTAFPFVKRAQFDSDDAMLGSIMEVGYRTARLCAHDTYMDTPYWERLQYVGDTRIQALISYAMTGDNRLPREAIGAFHHSAISDGITRSRYPASEFQVIPGFSLFWVGMVHDFWMHNDDDEFVRRQLPLVRSTLSWFAERQNENGLMCHLPWWSFVDWANGFERGVPPQDSKGNSAILSLQFVEALRYAAEMEHALGLDDLAQRDREQADWICAAVRKLCWSERYGLLADTPEKKHFSQHANAFGVWLDAIPRREQKRVMNTILSADNAGFAGGEVPPQMSLASYYFRFYVARAMVHAGLGDRYLETLGPWKEMLAEGLTTWAEMPPPSRSDSHAWSAHPNYDLLATVAGIRPGSPNFSSVRIEPRPGKLKRVHAAMPTPRGMVEVDLDLVPGKPEAVVTLPDGLAGSFVWNGKEYALGSGRRKISLASMG